MRTPVRVSLLSVLVTGAAVAAVAAAPAAAAAPPSNDDLAGSTVITAMPATADLDLTEATREPGEPAPSCNSVLTRTAWYSYTAPVAAELTASVEGDGYEAIAVYTGSGYEDLSQVDCAVFPGTARVLMTPGVTYHVQVATRIHTGPVRVHLDAATRPAADFSWSMGSEVEPVRFFGSARDPLGRPIVAYDWDFGDGTTGTGPAPVHQYAADGDYRVTFTVRTDDGRTASATRTVPVRTYDVAVRSLTVPVSARVGETVSIPVVVRGGRYPVPVTVLLDRGGDGRYDPVGDATAEVAANATREFRFSYTFTAADLAVGRVHFRATAYPGPAPDARPADNVLTSRNVLVRP
ncbi:MAG TPA: PKD domain-containing protein [Pseudonocardiaceae bacterium]